MQNVDRVKLNELLAEHVMEWKSGVMTTFNRTMTFFYDEGADRTYTSDELSFLTWEGMGLVVEAMKEKGFAFALEDLCDERGWRAEFRQTAQPWASRTEDTDDPKVSSAIAALKALGVEVK